MELESDHHFRFALSPAAFWAVAGSADRYTTWWPWLRSFDGRGFVAGDVWRCAVRPPLRYTVRFTVRLDEVVEAESIGASIDGDIAGHARMRVDPHGDGDGRPDGCVVRLTSTLRPRGTTLRAITLLAGPLARRGHDWILDTGAAQFARRARLPVGDDREV